MDYVPEVSAIDTTHFTVDSDTRDLLKKIGVSFVENASVHVVKPHDGNRLTGAKGGDRADRPRRA